MKQKKSENTALEQLTILLGRRAHSEHELRRKLKGFKEEQVERALKTARDRKWLMDPKEPALRLSEELNRKKKRRAVYSKSLKSQKTSAGSPPGGNRRGKVPIPVE